MKEVILESNIVLKVPTDYEVDLTLGKDLVNFCRNNRPHVYNKTAIVTNKDYGQLGFELLGLGTTNHVCFIESTDLDLEMHKQIANDFSLSYHVSGYVSTDLKNINEENKFDLVVGQIPTVDNFLEHIDFFTFVKNNMNLTGDMYLIEPKDTNLLRMCAEKYGMIYKGTFNSKNWALMYFKQTHDAETKESKLKLPNFLSSKYTV